MLKAKTRMFTNCLIKAENKYPGIIVLSLLLLLLAINIIDIIVPHNMKYIIVQFIMACILLPAWICVITKDNIFWHWHRT